MIGEYIATGAAVGGVFGAGKQVWNLGPISSNPKGIAIAAMARGTLTPTVHCALAGGLYAFGITTMAGLRNKEDALNGAAGGALVGIYAGLKGKAGLHGAVYKAIGFSMVGIACTFMGNHVEERVKRNAERNKA